MSPSSNPSHSTSALPRCTIPKLLCSGLCRWVLLCGFPEIKRKRRPAQAGCLCPLICKKQTPTKQVPVLIATPKGANWGQENELSFKTVVTAKTLRDKVSQERKKKKTHLVKNLTSGMGWQMNDGCRWENGIPFKEKSVICKAMRKLGVLGHARREQIMPVSCAHGTVWSCWNKPSRELLWKKAKPRAVSRFGIHLEEL